MNSHPALLVMTLAVLAVLIAELRVGVRVPAMVIQLVLGIIVGPHLLDLARDEGALKWLGENAGLSTLFFMVGLELDLNRVKGRPLILAAQGWGISLVLALIAGILLLMIGITSAPVIMALALSTTSLGLLSPVLRDMRENETRFGRMAIAAGAAGEFGPIIGISLVLSHAHEHWVTALLLLAFVVLALLAAMAALIPRPFRVVYFLTRTMHTSAQLPVLIAMLVLAAFCSLTDLFGLDTLLGAFAAGMVIGLATRDEESRPIRMKIEAISYGFFVPFYFVVSGISFDLAALSNSSKALALMPLFLILLLVVRGVPAMLLYRHDLNPKERLPFLLYTSMGLPIILAITQIGVRVGKMQPDIASSLVGAGILSLIIFPTVAGTLLTRSREQMRREAQGVV